MLTKTFLLVLVLVCSPGYIVWRSWDCRPLLLTLALISPATGDRLGPRWIPFPWDNHGGTRVLIVDCDTQRRSGEKKKKKKKKSWGPSRFFIWPLTSRFVGLGRRGGGGGWRRGGRGIDKSWDTESVWLSGRRWEAVPVRRRNVPVRLGPAKSSAALISHAHLLGTPYVGQAH